MTLPNAIYIGAPRAGSKWVYFLFQQHPDCYAPKIPDPFFFDREIEYAKGLGWYEDLFKEAPEGAQIIGEMSHDYLYSEIATQRIFEDLPCVRLFCTIRHPIERAVSHWNFYYQSGWNTSPFEQAIDENPEILEHSLYASHLRRYLDVFGERRFLIGLYDDMSNDAAAYAQNLFEFLGVKPLDKSVMGQRVNVSRKARNLMLGRAAGYVTRFLRQKSMTRLFGAIKSRQQPLSKIFYKDALITQKHAIPEATLARLHDYFRDDITLVEQLTGRNLSSWRRYDDE